MCLLALHADRSNMRQGTTIQAAIFARVNIPALRTGSSPLAQAQAEF